MAEERKKDVVYMYMFNRSNCKQVPNISPFAIKLATWLRLHNIEHEVRETRDFSLSPTRQIPFIHYNDVHMADSNLIIDFLTKELGLDPTEGLTPEQQGISRAITKMCEEELCQTYFMYRYSLHVDQWSRVFQASPVPKVDAAIKETMKKSILDRMNAIGIGRKTEEDVMAIGNDDVRALSNILGEKEYFMGGDGPTKVDCSVFGVVSQLYVDVPYPHKQVLEGEAANLTRFVDRMKRKLWPEWDEVVDSGVFE